MFDGLKSNQTSYEPYKYILQDTGSIYIGAKFSYKELLENENTGFKLKAIISQYLLKEADSENTLESQLYFLEQGNFIFETLLQLKVRVKVQAQVEKRNIFGKTKVKYQEKVYTLKELTDINLARKKASGMVITEMIISKLALMGFTV